MRAVRVETRHEVIDAGLLLEHVARRRLRRFAFEREMHALVPPVVLRMARLAALDLNPKAEPPHRELTEPVQRVR
jgi:hypothetical protein